MSIPLLIPSTCLKATSCDVNNTFNDEHIDMVFKKRWIAHVILAEFYEKLNIK